MQRDTYIFFIMIAFSILSYSLQASTDVDSESKMVKMDEVARGQLLFTTDQPQQFIPAPIVKTAVNMEVSGLIVKAHVAQTFTNNSMQWQEAVYIFPLPDNAAVNHLQMKIGQHRIIEGEIQEKQQAKKSYQTARKAGKQAALLQQQRKNVFTIKVANIAPNETIEIMIQYQQQLTYRDGRFSLRFPLVVAPRYVSKQVDGFTSHGWAQPPVKKSADALHNPVDIQINLQPGFALSRLESLYHQIKQQQQGDRWLVQLQRVVAADRDFVLEWSPAPGHAPTAALFTEQHAKEDYALLMLMPPVTNESSTQTLNRDVIFVIDTSGSMGGESIRQAKAALIMAVQRLSSHDRFNIVQFNSVTSQLFNQTQLADAAHIAQAVAYIQQLQADGGTEMLSALQTAFSQAIDAERITQVIFLTDGSVSNEDMLFQYIQQHLAQRRLFTVGIGSAPNGFFMRQAAKFGSGTYTYIGRINEVQAKMQQLFSKLESPVLNQIKIDWGQASVEAWPQRIPDLYAGEPLMVVAKLSELPDHVMVTGNRANQPWQSKIKLIGGMSSQGIHSLWGSQKIESLIDGLHQSNESAAVRQQVIDIALKHHLVSRYTSLVAIAKQVVKPQSVTLQSVTVPVNLPAGWDANKVFGRLPQTATSAPLNLWLGITLLLIAITIRGRKQ